MSGNFSRAKGARSERELFGMLSDELGFVVQRNISQTRGGGADCIEIPGWAVECKRCETLNINAWWAQAAEQSGDKTPILFYRQSRQPWKAILNLSDLVPLELEGNNLAQISFETACYIIRESLA